MSQEKNYWIIRSGWIAATLITLILGYTFILELI